LIDHRLDLVGLFQSEAVAQNLPQTALVTATKRWMRVFLMKKS
jgi:hypothetical protein